MATRCCRTHPGLRQDSRPSRRSSPVAGPRTIGLRTRVHSLDLRDGGVQQRFLISRRVRPVPTCSRPTSRPARCARLRPARCRRRVRRRLGARPTGAAHVLSAGPPCAQRTQPQRVRAHDVPRRTAALARGRRGADRAGDALVARRVSGMCARHRLLVAAPPRSGVVRRCAAGHAVVRTDAVADSAVSGGRRRRAGATAGSGHVAARVSGRRRVAGGRWCAATA